MSAEENKVLVRRYFEAISGKDKPPSVVDQFVADADPELKQHIVDAEQGFPRYELIAEDLIAEGDKVFVQARMRATHSGNFMGIPATGRQVEMPVALVYQIANGKIVAHWMLSDNMGLMQQLGVIPTPSSSQ
jgi:predicted ester cyclase